MGTLNAERPFGSLCSPQATREEAEPAETAVAEEATEVCAGTETDATAGSGRTSMSARRAAIWSGVVPQQPPTTCLLYTSHVAEESLWQNCYLRIEQGLFAPSPEIAFLQSNWSRDLAEVIFKGSALCGTYGLTPPFDTVFNLSLIHIFIYNCEATEVVLEDGVVAGVKAIRDNNTVLSIATKAVFLATGGFGASEEMIHDRFLGVPLVNMGTPTNSGDGIRMAEAAGAVCENSVSYTHLQAHSQSLVGPKIFSQYRPSFSGFKVR